MEISLSERPFAFFQKGQMCRIYRQLWKVNDMADMVKVEHLKKNFGDLEVLKDINLTVKEGEKLSSSVPPVPENLPLSDASTIWRIRQQAPSPLPELPLPKRTIWKWPRNILPWYSSSSISIRT